MKLFPRGLIVVALTPHNHCAALVQCRDCCCNTCNHGSSYCAFPRFNGPDIGDPVRNFAFYLMVVGIINFCTSYSIWANTGSPRMFLLAPSMLTAGAVLYHSFYGMKWLLCHPVAKPQDNLANWITMEAVSSPPAPTPPRTQGHAPTEDHAYCGRHRG